MCQAKAGARVRGGWFLPTLQRGGTLRRRPSVHSGQARSQPVRPGRLAGAAPRHAAGHRPKTTHHAGSGLVTETPHRRLPRFMEKEAQTDSEHAPGTRPQHEPTGQGHEHPAEMADRNAVELPESIPKYPVYRYNLDDSETPGGLKVRWKVRVITGPEAAKWEARQNAAILELLRWAHQHRKTR